jgi:general secretion pathway protein M
MMDYWHSLDARQQRVLMAAAVILSVVFVYVWIWEPLVETRAAERERVAQQQALLDWLDALVPVTEQLQRGGSRPDSLGDRSLLGLADETARAAGLAGALTRIEPAGERQVRVWLDGADFVATMGWLETLSRSQPIQVGQLQVDRARSRGQVNVRVTLVADA